MADETREEPGDLDLVVAVYLDTNVLLDLLATVEGGFTLVERVTSGQTGAEASERSGSTEFAAPSIFNMFRLGFTGKLGKSRTRGTSESTETDRTHTYGSLLHRLRSYLMDEGLVTALDGGGTANVQVGSFIEFTGVVRANPFTATFERLLRMLSFADVAIAMEAPPQPPAQLPGKGRGQNQPKQRPQANPQIAQLNAIREFIHQLTTDVEREGTSTIVFENVGHGYKAVATIFEDFLRDRSMAELLNRQFRVLGKAARHLPANSTEGVDLLASTGIAGFPPEIVESMTDAISENVIVRSGASRHPFNENRSAGDRDCSHRDIPLTPNMRRCRGAARDSLGVPGRLDAGPLRWSLSAPEGDIRCTMRPAAPRS